jgi:ATP-dependent HslUV protease ATP-binding subunit HslU
MKDLTPSQIVKELDKYIIGQQEAKKSVAIALRNRYRRRLLSDVMKDEITPRNIIMMGPTGVGKTEIARRLAKLLDAPFIKVEATKFTEVGYVGRDVESMIRDLVGTSIRLVKQREIDKVAQKTEAIVNDRLLDAIVPVKRKENAGKSPYDMIFGGQARPAQQQTEPQLAGPTEDEIKSRRELCRQELLEGKLEDLTIDIMVDDNDSVPIGVMGSGGGEEITMKMSNMLVSIFPKKKKKRRTTVAAARKIFTAEESQRLIDMDAIVEEGLRLAEQDGIIFLDEIDKIAGNGYKGSGPDISREGVQRDILPIVEGCTVTTKYGPVKTDYILFIGAGAFHMSKVSDLIPELQGRFPIKVKLQALSEEDFLKILTQPENAIIKQYKELLKTEGVDLVFENEALKSLAKIAFMENETSENIGARRLYTVMEKLLEDISFYASEYDRESFNVTEEYVRGVFKDEE